jgi:predicted TIM-barrel fold metal-dependent hydrolase
VGRLFAIAPDVRILWAHAGFYENAATISAMLDKYSNLTAELSLRAPNIMPAAAEDIGADWLALFERHSDRIVVGSDTYINLAWVEYDEIMDAHRNWLSRLPQHIAEKIAWRNAKTYFGLPEALFQTSRRDP